MNNYECLCSNIDMWLFCETHLETLAKKYGWYIKQLEYHYLKSSYSLIKFEQIVLKKKR